MLTEFFEASALDASWWSKKKMGDHQELATGMI